MKYAVCCVPVAPLRMKADHRSEMISQLLFGEYCVITHIETLWIKVENKFDGYAGWCSRSQFKEIAEAVFNSNDNTLSNGWINEIEYNGQSMQIPLGSTIRDDYNVKIWYAAIAKKDAATIKEISFKFLNTAYLWGGKSVFGIDCSGFTQTVFKFLNIKLLRDAQQQATQGELVGFLQEARCGDLAFFDNEDGHIIHVGILLSNHQIIHAAGKVRIDKIDNEGIINAETGQRTQRLRIIKRFM
jgi:gamma-D-glutamyl-L-lysine dipeptidyl-peptidase